MDVRKKHQSVASVSTRPSDQTQNLGMCSDQKSNPQPFGHGMAHQLSHPTRAIFFNPHLRIFLFILEREKEKGKEREGSIDWLPL